MVQGAINQRRVDPVGAVVEEEEVEEEVHGPAAETLGGGGKGAKGGKGMGRRCWLGEEVEVEVEWQEETDGLGEKAGMLQIGATSVMFRSGSGPSRLIGFSEAVHPSELTCTMLESVED